MDDTQQNSTPQSPEVLTEMESMIKNSVANLDRSKSELKKLNEMITSLLVNDTTYQEHEKQAKEANKVKNATKAQLLKDPVASATIQKIREMRKQIKEMQDGLSDYLREYQRMTGSNEIEDDNGDVREIVYVAKLVKRSSKFR